MINDEILHKWINNTISDEELVEFKKRPEYADLERIYKSTDDLSVDHLDSDKMLADLLLQDKGLNPQVLAKTKRMLWMPFIAAASIIMIIGFFFLPNGLPSSLPDGEWVKYDMAKAERMDGVLPDESTFVMNAESQLKYNREDWKEYRTLELKGEALFRVKKGSRFIVETPSGDVEVLGTVFNVKSRDGKLHVDCIEGKVKVSYQGQKSPVVIGANEAISINEKGNLIKEDEVNGADWVEGIIRLKNVSLKEVISSIERQFDVSIESNNIPLTQKLTCNFQTKDLDMALKTAIGHLDLSYKIVDEKKVVLEAK